MALCRTPCNLLLRIGIGCGCKLFPEPLTRARFSHFKHWLFCICLLFQRTKKFLLSMNFCLIIHLLRWEFWTVPSAGIDLLVMEARRQLLLMSHMERREKSAAHGETNKSLIFLPLTNLCLTSSFKRNYFGNFESLSFSLLQIFYSGPNKIDRRAG
jgi:hypothetical protein